LDNTKNANKGGTGLGLVIANKLAKRLGDKDKKGIELKSEVEVGSTFFFNIEDKEYTIAKNEDEKEDHALEPLVIEYNDQDLKKINLEEPENS
jgi:signal transduction histidine kinase